MKHLLDVPVLIIAYRRPRIVQNILDICAKNRASSIYVILDGPKKNSSKSALDDNLSIKLIVENFARGYAGKIHTHFQNNNIGCAPSVLTGCDWIFQKENNAIILEDDCIPGDDFFDFSIKSLQAMESDRNIWLSCGTQFAPENLFQDSWALSKYPLTWGWATNKNKWDEMRTAISGDKNLIKGSYRYREITYWNAGAQRARCGYADVWDTLLAQQMLVHNKFAIVPKVTLVSNVGFDAIATHTKKESQWVKLTPQNLSEPKMPPIYSEEISEWLSKNLFRIQLKHIFTTKLKKVFDWIIFFNHKTLSLNEKWDKANLIRKT